MEAAGRGGGWVGLRSAMFRNFPQFRSLSQFTISLGVGTECANSVGFQWLLSLLPDLCPLCVP